MSESDCDPNERPGANFTYKMVRFVGTMITDVNPFIYSHPLAPDDIIDRDEETTRLLAAAVGGPLRAALRAAEVRQDEPACAAFSGTASGRRA